MANKPENLNPADKKETVKAGKEMADHGARSEGTVKDSVALSASPKSTPKPTVSSPQIQQGGGRSS